MILSPGGRRYGYQRDSPDHRDLGIGSMKLAIPPTLPSALGLEIWCGPVKNQGSLGACTAFAGCGNREFLARKYENRSPVLSPLFLYYMERQLDGTLVKGDAGSSGRTDCRAMNQFGICEETEESYDPANYQIAPTATQVQAAGVYKAGAYHNIGSVQDMKLCLASGYCVLIGFAVYSSFEGSGIAANGLMPMPSASEQMLGGHEVLVIGYDDSVVGPSKTTGAFFVRNSWGSGWGDGGNFWMSYEFAANDSYLWDAWVQHLGKPWA
jgi:C1A family cysteine protease